MADQISPQEFAGKIRAKYPGSYDQLSDGDLTSKILAKYPQYQSSVRMETPIAVLPPGNQADADLPTDAPQQFAPGSFKRQSAEALAQSGIPAASPPADSGVVPRPVSPLPGVDLETEAALNRQPLPKTQIGQRFNLQQPPQAAENFVSGIEGYPKIASGAKKIYKSGALSNATGYMTPPAAPPVPVDRSMAVHGANEAIGGAMEAATPAIIAGGIANPLSTARGLGEAYLAGKVGHRLAEAAGADPDMQELIGNVAALAIGGRRIIGDALGMKGGVEITPEATTVGGSAFDGKVGAGVQTTPEVGTTVAAKIGEKVYRKTFGGKPEPGPALEPNNTIITGERGAVEGAPAAQPATAQADTVLEAVKPDITDRLQALSIKPLAAPSPLVPAQQEAVFPDAKRITRESLLVQPSALSTEREQAPVLNTPAPSNSQEFAENIRAKYPGAYDGISDADLTSKVLAKYPQYQSAEAVIAPVAVKTLITKADEANLRELGYDQSQIDGMKPEEAQAVIASPRVAPGARSAATGNEAGTTTMQDLTDSIKRQAAGRSLTERMRIGARIGEQAEGAKDAISQSYARLKGGTAALWEAYKNPPAWGDYEDATGKWSGAEQENALDLKRFTDAIKQAVPNKLRREALSNWIEAGGDDKVLADRAAKSKAPYKAGYEAARKLTDAEKTVAQNIVSRNDATLEEAQKAGILKAGVENYVRHIYKDNPKMERRVMAEMQFNSLTTKPTFTKQRKLPTYFDAEQLGLTPKDKDVGFLTASHEQAFREALAARDYIKSLMEGKAKDGRPLVMVSASSAKEISPEEGEKSTAYMVKSNLKAKDDYADYRTLDHPALRGWRWAGKTETGAPIFVQGDALIHPDVYTKIRNNLTRSAIRAYEAHIGALSFRPGAAALNVSQNIKSAILSLSGFHQTTLGVHALEHRTMPAGMPQLDLNDATQKALVDHGLMVAHYHAQDAFGEGIVSGGIVTKIPGIGPAYHAYTDYLFSSYLPRVKMAMAKNALARNRELYKGELSDDQILAMTARQANAAFGGLNYKMLGRNKTMQDVLRLGLMAPDFLEARGRFAAQAARPFGREQLNALLLGGLVAYTVARILNKMMDGNAHWDKPFAVVYHEKQYELRLIQQDIFNAVTDTGKFAMNRLSPVVHTAIQLGQGRDRFGRKQTIGQHVAEAARNNVPIPVQPWTRKSKDTNAEKAIETIYKIIGINVKKAETEKGVSRGVPSYLRVFQKSPKR